MYNQPFYVPRFYGGYSPMMTRGLVGRNSMFSRIGTLFSNIKNYNWTGLINNTSKTLGVIKETIPIVKQVKPVVNNMRSMIKIASVFKDETDNTNTSDVKEVISNYNDSPTFFV